MKKIISALFLGILLLSAHASDFSRASRFTSVEDFLSKAKDFEPAAFGTDLAALFTVPELGQPEDPKTGKPVVATAVESSENVWASDSQALVFVKALPPTEATDSVAGVLFLLKRTGDSWGISDSRQFTANGKDSGISAEQTASAGGSREHLKGESFPPVVTITEIQGGRGYSYELSASYGIKAEKLERLDLK